MIWVAFDALEVATAVLDELMGPTVGGREGPGLMNNALFESYDEDVPLSAPGSPGLIFAHEQKASIRLVDQNPYANVLTFVLQHRVDEVGESNGGGEYDGNGGNDGQEANDAMEEITEVLRLAVNV